MDDTQYPSLMKEAELVLEALSRFQGFDFRGYAPSHIQERLTRRARDEGCERLIDLVPLIVRDSALAGRISEDFSIPHSTMFRNPEAFRNIVNDVIPWLGSYPVFRIWHAGCATGEEVLSLAILLREAGLYDRATIFATDMSETALSHATLGVYDLGQESSFAKAYVDAGGHYSLSEYFTRRAGHMVFDRSLLDRVTFAKHNLAVDEVFSEFHLIVCRNVTIYFTKELRNRALRVFNESLTRGGYLWLGDSERIGREEFANSFEVVSREARIYRRTRPTGGRSAHPNSSNHSISPPREGLQSASKPDSQS